MSWHLVITRCRAGGLLLATSMAFQVTLAQEGSIKFETTARAADVPEVAIARLRVSLTNAPNDQKWPDLALQLAQAFLAGSQPTEALKLLDDPRLATLPSAKFWRAQAMAATGRWSDALGLYQAVAAEVSSPLRKPAIFGVAEMLRALQRPNEALQALALLLSDKQWANRARLRSAELFLDKSDAANARRMLDQMNSTSATLRKERRYLRARLDLVQQHPDKGRVTLEGLVKKPEGASHALIMAALFAIADAHLQLKTPESGDDFLEDFIEHHPRDPELSRIFAKLDELYRAERKPARTELERWTRDAEQPRRALAMWYLARIEFRAGRRDRAVDLLAGLARSGPTSAALAPALLEYAHLELEERHYERVLSVLDQARALHPEPAILDRINLAAAEARYQSRQFEAAAVLCEPIGETPSPFARVARINASLGWLQAGNYPRFLAQYAALQKEGDSGSQAELRLEEGLVRAGKGEPDAAESLRKFIREFPTDPRLSEAWVALAELAFHANPPRLQEAREDLARAAESKPTAAAEERSAYLRIWLEEALSKDESRVIELADKFLKEHPDSAFAPDVRLKLAETYYRRQDFPNAQTEFEILAQQGVSGAMAEQALFFAAESAMSAMGSHALEHALVLFDRVVQLKGDLRWAARNEEAIIERKLGKPQEAVVLYDEVLKGDGKPGEKREALCGKGDIYFDLGTEDPKNYERAIEIYDQLAKESREPGHWRNQALFKKGECQEKTADKEAALATFYQVLEEQTRPDRPPELFWFYRAGFNAARLLEDASKWESAAAVYEKLVAAGGARTDEAKARLSQLRLEHFLWKD